MPSFCFPRNRRPTTRFACARQRLRIIFICLINQFEEIPIGCGVASPPRSICISAPKNAAPILITKTSNSPIIYSQKISSRCCENNFVIVLIDLRLFFVESFNQMNRHSPNWTQYCILFSYHSWKITR